MSKTKRGLSRSKNFHGPYCIIAKLSPVHFQLRTLENCSVSEPVHVNCTKPYFDPNDRQIQPPPDTDGSLDLADSDLPDTIFKLDRHNLGTISISDDTNSE